MDLPHIKTLHDVLDYALELERLSRLLEDIVVSDDTEVVSENTKIDLSFHLQDIYT